MRTVAKVLAKRKRTAGSSRGIWPPMAFEWEGPAAAKFRGAERTESRCRRMFASA